MIGHDENKGDDDGVPSSELHRVSIFARKAIFVGEWLPGSTDRDVDRLSRH